MMKDPSRRDFVVAAGAGLMAAALPGAALGQARGPMYGLIGRIDTLPGQRDAVVAALLEGTTSMPGCLGYVVAEDPARPESIWVTETWDSRQSHAASLELPGVRQAIARARPHIAGFGERIETVPVGGLGLSRPGRGA